MSESEYAYLMALDIGQFEKKMQERFDVTNVVKAEAIEDIEAEPVRLVR